eukprot:TRINITY_DN6338_c0_g1_i2.p1 TRINITY_DN6338_c0_g1~~TRINITY_DN6338_c0_g1_i2.p1  ORF type:complete len:585 (-),score=201.82 TRINITY_DN6338_c0_g1_i2:100-1854(-)
MSQRFLLLFSPRSTRNITLQRRIHTNLNGNSSKRNPFTVKPKENGTEIRLDRKKPSNFYFSFNGSVNRSKNRLNNDSLGGGPMKSCAVSETPEERLRSFLMNSKRKEDKEDTFLSFEQIHLLPKYKWHEKMIKYLFHTDLEDDIKSPMLQNLSGMINNAEIDEKLKFYALSHASLKVHRHVSECVSTSTHRIVDDRIEWRKIQEAPTLEVHLEKSPLYWISFIVNQERWKRAETQDKYSKARDLAKWMGLKRERIDELRKFLKKVRGKMEVVSSGTHWPRTEAIQYENRLRKVERFLLTFLGSMGRSISSVFPTSPDINAKLKIVFLQQQLLNEFLKTRFDRIEFNDEESVSKVFLNDEEYGNWIRESESKLEADFLTKEEKMNGVLHLMQENINLIALFQNRLNRVVRIYGRSSWITRRWLALVLAAYATKKLFARQDIILKYLDNVRISLDNFSSRFLGEPLRNMYNTVRHDTSNFKVIQSPESLNLHVDSLGRMVKNFAEKTGKFTQEQLLQIEISAKKGDIQPILSAYEHDIRNPLKSALFGDLIQLILVQVQKQRVDIERAMLAIDQLLRANEDRNYSK